MVTGAPSSRNLPLSGSQALRWKKLTSTLGFLCTRVLCGLWRVHTSPWVCMASTLNHVPSQILAVASTLVFRSSEGIPMDWGVSSWAFTILDVPLMFHGIDGLHGLWETLSKHGTKCPQAGILLTWFLHDQALFLGRRQQKWPTIFTSSGKVWVLSQDLLMELAVISKLRSWPSSFCYKN